VTDVWEGGPLQQSWRSGFEKTGYGKGGRQGGNRGRKTAKEKEKNVDHSNTPDPHVKVKHI